MNGISNMTNAEIDADIAQSDSDDDETKRLAEPKQEASTNENKKQADKLIRLVLEHAIVFHAADDSAWADITIDGRRETRSLRSKQFKRWLHRQYHLRHDTSVSTEAMTAAIAVLEGKAHYEGEEREVFTRIGGDNGKIYVDLADREWRGIEIDARGWRIITDIPVRFRRPGTPDDNPSRRRLGERASSVCKC
jgi:hypothetical protein